MFKPIDKKGSGYPNKHYEKIIVSLNDLILNGKIKQGDKLPSERELADQFQTSRVPVREALKILEFLGAIESINGNGMYIKNIEISALMNKIFFAININESTLKDLFEVRILLECYSARRAAILRDEDDLGRLAQSIEDMGNAVSSAVTPTKASLDFHLAVVMSAKNIILTNIYEFLDSLLEKSREYTLTDHIRQPDSLAYHRQIYNMIEKQDIDGAERSMREHLQDELNRI